MRLWRRCFPVNFAKLLRTPFLRNPSGKLNNSKSKINCTDDIYINNRQSCNHVKLFQPESSNCAGKNNSGNENNYTNNSNDKEKKT